MRRRPLVLLCLGVILIILLLRALALPLLPVPEDVRKATIVTSDYHLPRALRIARDAGLTADGLVSATLPEYWLKNHAREVLAWGKYFLSKLVPLN